MPALFRIVQDDCPPIPEGASPIVKDFLYHCFQKDCNLRISAKKLLKHPWMVSARKQMATGQKTNQGTEGSRGDGRERGKTSNYNYDEAVLKVQEWNEALKCNTLIYSSLNLCLTYGLRFPQLLQNLRNTPNVAGTLSRRDQARLCSPWILDLHSSRLHLTHLNYLPLLPQPGSQVLYLLPKHHQQ